MCVQFICTQLTCTISVFFFLECKYRTECDRFAFVCIFISFATAQQTQQQKHAKQQKKKKPKLRPADRPRIQFTQFVNKIVDRSRSQCYASPPNVNSLIASALLWVNGIERERESEIEVVAFAWSFIIYPFIDCLESPNERLPYSQGCDWCFTRKVIVCVCVCVINS